VLARILIRQGQDIKTIEDKDIPQLENLFNGDHDMQRYWMSSYQYLRYTSIYSVQEIRSMYFYSFNAASADMHVVAKLQALSLDLFLLVENII